MGASVHVCVYMFLLLFACENTIHLFQWISMNILDYLQQWVLSSFMHFTPILSYVYPCCTCPILLPNSKYLNTILNAGLFSVMEHFYTVVLLLLRFKI